jgi:hypothetical protein
VETRAPAFNAWLDDFFASYYRHRPVNATFIGFHDYDGRLPDFSPEGEQAARTEMKGLLERLRSLPPEPLTESESLDHQLAEGFLEIQLWEFGSRHFHRGNPCVYTGEAVFGVMSLFLRPFAPLADRVESAIKRLAAVPAFLTRGKENVREAPPAWSHRAIRECEGALAFLREGIDIIIKESGIGEPDLRQEADNAASAFEDFERYLEEELLQKPSYNYACGEKTLDLLLRRGHFLKMNAQDVEDRAWEWMSENEALLEEHASDFRADHWKAALSKLAEHHPPADRYYARYQEVWNLCRAKIEERRLLTWPSYPIRYVPQPRWARKAAPHLYFLFYRAPAAFDRVPTVEYLVTPIEPEMTREEQQRLLRATNDSVIKLNHVVHHGGPGHHVQNWHAYRAASRIGQVAAVDCASRIAMFCGGTMAEGWACYATDLMEEFGFLTPLEQYAEHRTRLRVAARAIVDVRLHQGEFTLEDAADFYRDRVGMASNAAQSEAVKNSMFPGTALMYLVGTDLIHKLRRDLEARQAPTFDLQRFHDRFLSYGSAPVSLIAESMRKTTVSSVPEP